MTHADVLGRWTAIKLTGKNENNILIINYYQSINKKSIDKAGSKTSWAQQYVTLQKHHPKPNPTKQSTTDLQKFLTKHLKATDKLILTGDFNAKLGIGNEYIHSVIVKYNLSDLQGSKHGLDDEIPTYARGRKRLDYTFVTQGVLAATNKCGLEPFLLRIQSDHRGQYIDINKNMLLN